MFGLKAGILASVASGGDDAARAGLRRRPRALAASRRSGSPSCPGRRRCTSPSSTTRTGRATTSRALRVAVTGAADIPVELIRRVHDELPFSQIVTGYGLTEGGTACATSDGDDAGGDRHHRGPAAARGSRCASSARADRDVAAGRGRRGAAPRREHHGRLPRRPRGDGQGALARRLAAHRRPRDARRRRPPAHRRPGEGHVHRRAGSTPTRRRSRTPSCGTPPSQQAAVIGIPDERLGEVGMAFVVVSEPVSGRRHHRVEPEQMANYKVPRVVEIVDALPLNATGKVMKDDLCASGRPAHGRGPDDGDRACRADRAGRPAGRRDGCLGRRALGRRRCWPTGARTSSRWSRRSGDPMRSAFGSLGIGQDFPNPAFAQDNRGKRSVVLDLREPEARERLEELLASADVFVTNLRPDALDGLGLEPAATVGPPPAPRLLQRERVRPAGRGPQPPGLRHRRLLGPLGPLGPAGQQRGRAAQRPRRHRGPHQRAGRPGRDPGRRARAAADRAGGASSRSRCCAPGPTSSAGT